MTIVNVHDASLFIAVSILYANFIKFKTVKCKQKTACKQKKMSMNDCYEQISKIIPKFSQSDFRNRHIQHHTQDTNYTKMIYEEQIFIPESELEYFFEIPKKITTKKFNVVNFGHFKVSVWLP